jgi:hypothetical protein
MVEATGLKYGVEVTFNGTTSGTNFMKIHQSFIIYYGGGGRTDRQAGDRKSLLSFLIESRLKEKRDADN